MDTAALALAVLARGEVPAEASDAIDLMRTLDLAILGVEQLEAQRARNATWFNQLAAATTAALGVVAAATGGLSTVLALVTGVAAGIVGAAAFLKWLVSDRRAEHRNLADIDDLRATRTRAAWTLVDWYNHRRIDGDR